MLTNKKLKSDIAMATFKPCIIDHKRYDNTYGVRIRITHNRTSSFIKTNIYLSEKDIVKKSKKIKNQSIIDILENQIREYRSIINSSYIEDMTAKEVVDLIISKSAKFKLDIFEYTETLIPKMKEGTARSYKAMLMHLEKCIGKRKLDIRDLKKPLLEKYKSYLIDKNFKRGDSLYLNCLKKVFNAACKEYNGDNVDDWVIRHNPFRNFTIPEEITPESRAMAIDQLREFINMPYMLQRRYGPNDSFNKCAMAKDVFVLSLFLMGINSADLYETNIIDLDRGIIHYKRKKIKDSRKSDNGYFEVRIEPEIKDLVMKYLDNDEKSFVFHKHYSTPDIFNQQINKGLSKIMDSLNEILKTKKIPQIEKLQYYNARHTMATLCQNDLNKDTILVHELLNHKPLKQINTTMKYIKRDFSRLWDINREFVKYVMIGNNYDPTEKRRLDSASNNKSGYRCIYKQKNNTYRISFTHCSKRYELGCYKTLEEAIKIRDAKFKELNIN